MQNKQDFIDIVREHEALIYKITRVYAEGRIFGYLGIHSRFGK